MKKTKEVRRSIILSAVAALAFGGVAVGTTYALFTSESKTDVTIATGKVDVKASLTDLVTYSGVDLTGNPETDVLAETTVNGTFTNGGTATISGTKITLDKMTPGDKVTFDVLIHNDSNVNSMYRTVATLEEDDGLYSGLVIKIDDKTISGKTVRSDYVDLAVGSDDIVVKVSIELPSDCNNIYQGKKCVLSYGVEAVQGNAFKGTYEVTPETLQSYLDGEHGSIDNATLVLTAGDYPAVELGRATKEADSNTEYYLGGFSSENKKTYEEFVQIKNNGTSSASYYVRNMKNVTLKAAPGATVTMAGINATAGHIYGSADTAVHDYVLEKDFHDNSGYYLAQNWENITVEGIDFTAPSKIYSSQEETVISGMTFKDCSFTTGTIEGSSNQGLNFSTERNWGKVTDLVIENCTFKNCYQSIYTNNIYGVRVTDSSFDTTGHNAIAIQDNVTYYGGTSCDHGMVVIKNNTFSNIGDRIIRFGCLGADTQIIIKDNKATDSGDEGLSVIKASLLSVGILYDIANNDWGEGTSVSNTEFKDR